MNILKMRVSIVILAWNHKSDTIECIDSLLESVGILPSIMIVDNGSIDGTYETLEYRYDGRVKILRSEKNLGVAGGYNIGIRHAYDLGYDYIFITNNDVVFEKHMLYELINFALQKKEAGIISPKIYNYYTKNRLWMIGAYWRKFPPGIKMIAHNEKDSPKYQLPMQLDLVPSCCFLINRNAIEKVGLFDESYFFYFDDWDFSLRMRNEGFSIWMVPSAIAWHKVSVSTQKQKKPYFWWKQMGYSASIFYTKHYSGYKKIFGLGWLVLREIIKMKPIQAIGILEGIIERFKRNNVGSRRG